MEIHTGGCANTYLHSSPIYWITVARYLRTSSQKWLAENLGAMTTEQPLIKQDVRISIELIHACLISSVNEKKPR